MVPDIQVSVVLVKVYLSIGALSQHFKQLELRGVCFLTTLLNMVADVNLLKYTVILRKERQTSQLVCYLHIQTQEKQKS